MVHQLHHRHPTRHRRARAWAIGVAAAGVALLLFGHLFVWFGPIATNEVLNWFIATNIIGIMMVFLSVMVYWTYMEQIEPEAYRPEPTHPGYEGERG